MIGRLRTGKVQSVDDVRSQLFHLSQALKAIGQISQEEIAIAVERLQPAVSSQNTAALHTNTTFSPFRRWLTV